MMWTVEPRPAQNQTGYTLIGCVEGGTLLYVLIEADSSLPRPEPPDLNRSQVNVTVTADEALTWQGISVGWDKHGGLIMAKFDRPTSDTTHLTVDLAVDDVPTLSGRVQRISNS